MTNQDRIIALIRTAVPSLYGAALAWAISLLPFMQTAFDWLSATFEQDVVSAIESVFTVACIAAFYWVARKAGARWPGLEKWLLGRSLVPIYETDGVYVVYKPSPEDEAAFAAGETRRVQE